MKRKGLLIGPYLDTPPTPLQAMAAELLVQTFKPEPDAEHKLIDTRHTGSSVGVLVPILERHAPSAIVIPLLDKSQLSWASALIIAAKRIDSSTRAALLAPGDQQQAAGLLNECRIADTVVPVNARLLSASVIDAEAIDAVTDLLASCLQHTVLGVLDGDAFDELYDLAYRQTPTGKILTRPPYTPVMFGTEYFDEPFEKLLELSQSDRAAAESQGASLLYGEVAEPGVDKLLNEAHCDAAHASVLYDLGMGKGRLILQAFHKYPTLSKVVGVELSQDRFSVAARAIKRYAALHDLAVSEMADRLELRAERGPLMRQLILICGDLFDVRLNDLRAANIVLLLTNIPHHHRLCALINELPSGTRIATYEELPRPQVAVRELPARRATASHALAGSRKHRRGDGFATSWNPDFPYLVWQRD